MKALVYDENRILTLQDVPIPEPRDGWVRIKVCFAGICASDLHILSNDILLNVTTPRILGHEFSGIVDKIGNGVCGIQVGDRVSSETTSWSCGHCLYCISGQYNLCHQRKILGYTENGVHAEYTIVPAERVHKLKGISLLHGAMLEPLACCIHAVIEKLPVIKRNDVIVIAGPGTIGLLCTQILRDYRVIVYGTKYTPDQRYEAAYLCAPYCVTNDAYVNEVVNKTSNNLGADIFIECAGSNTAINQGLQLLKRGGTFVQIGLPIPNDPVKVDFSQIAYKEINAVGSIGSKHSSWELAKRLVLDERINPDILISETFALENYKHVFARLRNGSIIKGMFRL
jgi:L-iditol 2-dehydrogenase